MHDKKVLKPLPTLPMEVIIRRIAFRMGLGFSIVIAMIWINSLLDLHHLLFDTPAQAWLWPENVMETILILMLALIVFININSLLKRLKYLKGFLPVCASCKKIRLPDDSWIPIEKYIQDRSDAHFSHGICPDCVKKYYPDFKDKK